MPNRNVNLTNELDSIVLAKVESRRYENASEVFRAEQHSEARLDTLRTAIDKGDSGGVARGNSFDRVRRKLKLSKQS